MTVVAVVPAFRRADTVGETVDALVGLVDEVVVVDDGSADGGATAEAAAFAGARVVALPANVGKGGALDAGVAAAPDADVYLLVDADVGATAAAAAEKLLPPVLEGKAGLAIGVLSRSGTSKGLGMVKGFARWGIRRACGYGAVAPLSGQRAVDGPLLRSVSPLARRFGVEVAMTIDAVRGGARVVEVPVAMTHRRTGWTPAGIAHRGRQGAEVVRALWPRLVAAPTRHAIVALAAFLLVLGCLSSGGSHRDRAEPIAAGTVKRVVIVGIPGLPMSSLTDATVPAVTLLGARGAIGAANVRSRTAPPTEAAAWATVGAGERATAMVGDTRDPAAFQRRNRDLTGHVGALGTALRDAGFGGGWKVMVPSVTVGDAEEQDRISAAALAVLPPDLLGRTGLLGDGGRTGVSVIATTGPFDVDTAQRAVVEAAADRNALVIVIGLTPAGSGLHLAPVVITGPGVPAHTVLQSPNTGRRGILTLPDIAPTALRALGVPLPADMVGKPLELSDRPATEPREFDRIDRIGHDRERAYYRIAIPFIVVQVALYLAVVAWGRSFAPRTIAARIVRVLAVAIAAFPAACLIARAVAPDHPVSPAVLAEVAGALTGACLCARRTPLSPLSWALGATVATVAYDLATGGLLQFGSLMGYGFASTSRFLGITNTTFTTLFAATLMLAALHVHHAPRRSDALVTVAALFAVVLVVDGAPTLGDDVGGILTLAVAFGLTWMALARRRIRARTAALAGAGAIGLLLAAIAADLARPASSRTHLGRFASRVVREGPGELWSTVADKVRANAAAYTNSWSVIILGITLALAWWLVRRGMWERWLPAGSALRTGVVATVLTGLLGMALNDSGAIVVAQTFSFFGPAVVLLVLAGNERATERAAPAVAEAP